MLIQLLIEFVFVAFEFFTSLVNLPDFPPTVDEYVGTFFEILKTGLAVLSNYLDLSYLFTLLSLYITLVLTLDIYKLIMWIIKKIPLLGIK